VFLALFDPEGEGPAIPQNIRTSSLVAAASNPRIRES
jgi:hypothetical protein